MNEIKIFRNPQFGSIRTMTQGGEPWFVDKDVAELLGYAKPENAVATHVDSEDKTTTLIQGTGSNYKSKAVLINESGLYSLILSSKLPTAKALLVAQRQIAQRDKQLAEMQLFEIKESVVAHADGHTSINKTPKVTGKGQIYFINKLRRGAYETESTRG